MAKRERPFTAAELEWFTSPFPNGQDVHPKQHAHPPPPDAPPIGSFLCIECREEWRPWKCRACKKERDRNKSGEYNREESVWICDRCPACHYQIVHKRIPSARSITSPSWRQRPDRSRARRNMAIGSRKMFF